ncbi:protein TIC 62, chloroplastic isoform X1 [Typha latifolia]|uniref:protein TIC 62, chloroplastic isoform X1 n=1 Tax=Typha latifolia TaxID=4733 RepID=UPI003C2D8697
MELFAMRSPRALTSLPLSSMGRAKMQKPNSILGDAVNFTNRTMNCPGARNAGLLQFRPRASGAPTGSSPSTSGATKHEASPKADDLVFVAGSTGRVGSRTVRELLRLGFRVRAGVRSSQRAASLVQSVRQMKQDDLTETSEIPPVEKLEIVECDLEKEDGIIPAIGNASIVICCIGASEKEVFDVTGPYRIDYEATKNLIKAATIAKVGHFILLTSLGTNKIGFPAAILNLFWGVLIWKRKAEEVLIASGLPYTIVRPGGMERPTDSYKETHNIVLANEDMYFGGQVSNLQVAELMACMAKNRRLSFCKVVEVIAETTAPLLPMEELLTTIPSQRELPTEKEPGPVPSTSESRPAKEIVEDKPKLVEELKPRPFSPYMMYDDLKPPTSPTPTPSTTQGSREKTPEKLDSESKPTYAGESLSDTNKKESVQAPDSKTRPLSPYTAYEDLKPPSSPTLTSSRREKFASNTLPVVLDIDNTGTDGFPSINSQNSSHLSPYPVYDDLKPPTSPSPNAPAIASSISAFAADSSSQMSMSTINETSNVNGSSNEQHNEQEKQQPLSPYAMYEDLKPPTSPVPSVPKF